MTGQLDVSTEAIDLVNSLCLEPHPEGGWFRRTWTAPAVVETEGGRRATASAILFLLDQGMEARWHLVRSDELWLWHGPGALEIQFGGTGDAPCNQPETIILGAPQVSTGNEARTQSASPSPHQAGTPQVPTDAANPVQVLVKAGTWQRTFARNSVALATCVVSPEFTYEDWRLAENV